MFPKKRIKTLAHWGISLATIVLLLIGWQLYGIYHGASAPLDDGPGALKYALLYAYPVLLLGSWAASGYSRSYKTAFDPIANVLFLLNGLALLLGVVVFVMFLTERL